MRIAAGERWVIRVAAVPEGIAGTKLAQVEGHNLAGSVFAAQRSNSDTLK